MSVPCGVSQKEARIAARRELDDLPDVVIDAQGLRLRQELRVVATAEVFVPIPDPVVERMRVILATELSGSVARVIHDNVYVEIGCNRIPLFALVSGGCDRTLFTFRCVYARCHAFLEARIFSGVYSIKWIATSLSHSHRFDVFPTRMPRSTFSDATLQHIEAMIVTNKTCAEIRLENDILCNKFTYQSATRKYHQEKKAEQSRELRDFLPSSRLWNSEIRLSENNVFHEAFFSNAALVLSGVTVDFVYVDDTSCTNTFFVPRHRRDLSL